MKKLVAILLSLAMVLSLAACGSKTPASTEAPKPGESTAAPQAAWPKGNIDIIVPFKAGGAMDLSARLTADYLKKYLNVEVTVQNVEGGANWVGYNQIRLHPWLRELPRPGRRLSGSFQEEQRQLP